MSPYQSIAIPIWKSEITAKNNVIFKPSLLSIFFQLGMRNTSLFSIEYQKIILYYRSNANLFTNIG